MEPEEKPRPRYRNLTEKSKSLLFMLREIPYITLKDIRRLFYPGQKTFGYSREMIRYMTKSDLLHPYRLGGGQVIYYLTQIGMRILEFYIQDIPKFHSETSSFYYARPPAKPSERNPFFFFPARELTFRPFALKSLSSHPFYHTQALMELYAVFTNMRRHLYVLWLDMVKSKKDSLHIPHNPDLLLTNDYRTEGRRIYIELENSKIRESALIPKLDGLCSMPAEWYLFLCTSEPVFLNLGRVIRRILSGLAKRSARDTLFFSGRTHSALSKNVLIGLWIPSWKNKGRVQDLRETLLYRYDAPIFDKHIWTSQVTPDGIQVKDPQSGLPIRRLTSMPYESRKPGEKVIKLGPILDTFSDDFKTALRRALLVPKVPVQGEGAT